MSDEKFYTRLPLDQELTQFVTKSFPGAYIVAGHFYGSGNQFAADVLRHRCTEPH